MSRWLVYLRDGTSTQVDADEVLLEHGVRFVDNALDHNTDERYTDVLIVAHGCWARIEAADANLTWTPATPPPRVPSTF